MGSVVLQQGSSANSGAQAADRFHLAHWLPIPLFVLLVAILYELKITSVSESPVLLTTLNTLFCAGASLLVAYLSGRTYFVTGSRPVLFLGCGALAFAITYLLAGPLMSDLAVAVTVHNTGVCLAGACFVLSAAWAVTQKPREAAPVSESLRVALTYLGVLALMGLLVWGAQTRTIPDFFIAGQGTTMLRQIVLGFIVGEFLLAALCFGILYGRDRTGFLRWYCLGLALVGLGMGTLALESGPGTPLSWVGRSGQYLGGLSMLLAILSVPQDFHSWGIPLAKAFRETQDRYRTLVDLSPDAILVHSEGKYVYANPAAVRLFGAHSAEDIIGKDVLGLIHPDDRKSVARRVEEAYGGAVAPLRQTRFVRLDGGFVDVDVTGGRVRFDGKWAIQIVVRDITDRKQAEEAQRESERRERERAEELATMLDAVPTPVIIVHDPDATHMTGNRAADELLRQPHGAEVSLSAPPGSKPGHFKAMKDGRELVLDELPAQRAARGEHVQDFEFNLVFDDGITLHLLAYGTPLLDEKGSPRGAVHVLVDITDRKRAEVALQRSEERYRTLFETMTEGFALDEIICDESGKPYDLRYLAVNPAFERQTGLKAADIIGRTTLELFPQAEPIWFERYGKVALTGEPADFDEVFGPLGRWFKVSSFQTEPGRFAVVFTDITEHKQAEETLRESEMRFRSVLENSQDVIYRQNIETGRYEYVSPSVETVTSFPAEWFLTTDVETVRSKIHPDDMASMRAALASLEGAGKAKVEYRWQTKSGDWRWLSNHMSLVKDDAGATLYRDGSIRDITERRRADEALRESEVKYRNLFLNMTEEVHFWKLVRDESGEIKTWRVVDANPPALKTWERKSLEDTVGRTADEIYPGATDHYMAVVQKIMKENVPYSFDDYFPPPVDKYFRFTSVPLGEYFITTGADITGVKKAQVALQKAHDELELRVQERTEELRAAYEKLKKETEERSKAEEQLRQAQKMEALGTLSGGIAHDFNNILAAIVGFTELIGGRIDKGSRDAHRIDRIMEASTRGRDLVQQMLTFSRKAEQEKKPLRVSSIVKETVKLIRATTPTTISIKVNTMSESDLILGDPTQIQQVLMNLCTNAAYAMREKGGSLDIDLNDFSVSASNEDPDGIKPGLYVKLTVRDTGTGIPGDIMDKIFDPFFTTKKLGEGTGLGLSVVHGIVKHSNGHITVESELGRGSTFTVYFPKITGELETGEASDDELLTGSERILFVDDEEALVEMGEDILAELGYEVTSRMNGREALALLKEDPSRFDLVITDQTMPEMTGVELAKEVLAIRPDMPMIMCTGFSYVVDADKARAAGIKAFTMKPLTKREIAKTIRTVLDEQIR
ncbi:MAG: PAS domain S-box protein [Syntrophorhabdales bacterium]